MSEVKTGDEAPAYRRNSDDVTGGQVLENADGLARRLNNRQIQLIAIGGSVGTALFVSIGEGLVKGGPGSLLIAYLIYSCMLGLVNNCMAEMATYMPVSGGFIRMAGKWVDDALGFVSPPIRAPLLSLPALPFLPSAVSSTSREAVVCPPLSVLSPDLYTPEQPVLIDPRVTLDGWLELLLLRSPAYPI